MRNHHFEILLKDDQKNVVGIQCSRCGEILLYMNGVLSPEKVAEECSGERSVSSDPDAHGTFTKA